MQVYKHDSINKDREADALRIIQTAFEFGIQYVDTAASYGAKEIF
ncbi:hypothetical protein [Tolypothrix sp. FACHB-123]|nr:hypothetical protein [Tolypothrix sp. FACHB-123]